MTPTTAPNGAEATALIHEIAVALEADGTLAPGSFDVVMSHRRTRHALTTLLDGRHVVRILPTSTAFEIVRFVRQNASRLESNARRLAERAPLHPTKHLTDGCKLTWLGNAMRLRLVDTPVEVHLRPQAEGADLLVAYRGDITRLGAQPVIDWYCRAGLDWLQAAAPAHWSRLRTRRQLPALAVCDVGSRYGGGYAERTHQLTLHWAVFQLPPALLEYALVHELVHGTRPGGRSHGPTFRARLLRALPDAPARHRQFKAAFRVLWIGNVN
ncbi:M48 family metallopeptidase [Streptomyces sp. NBC_01433]|uniref:YgjP-like metallopeptidase domain-containing protein n=1 Tax=Streptomyces sp. NBC_01433 TaxID=2903864 RepID=UPI00225295F6|nr:YgjP-like metallopeptidase domain-containing protein [Streptomyces sp. NBC_01433]MCX4682286.1 M48 family metallopeptidase [Streptomyces sp. NBC_01433]